MKLLIDKKKVLTFSALCFLSPLLAACGSGSTNQNVDTSLPPAKNAEILYGEKHDKLSVIKALHEKTPDDAMIAARYGKALREAGQFKSAKSILLPLANNSEVATLVNTELSAVYLSQAEFGKAESAARKAIKADNRNYRAWRNLGNALDAQEDYKEGEEAFRKALELWTDEDKVPVMNNLALNLAAQGYTDKALTMLYDAQKMDPNRVEIERNIRIIRTLNEPPEYKGLKIPTPKNKAPE